MGGHDSTAKVVVATVNLAAELLGWISEVSESHHGGKPKKDLIKPSVTEGGDFDTLSQDCYSRCSGHFLQQFGYVYNGNDSDPPQATKDKKASNEDFFNAQKNNIGVLPAAVAASIKGTTAPWATSDMINDISARLQTITEGDPTNAFFNKAFTLDYTDTGSGSTGETYQVDISWVYCTSMADDPQNPGQQVNTLFLYSLGVAYIAEAWEKRLQFAPPAIPIIRIAFAYTTMVTGTAISAFILSAKDKPTNIYATVDVEKGTGTISISTKDKPKLDSTTGQPNIEYAWAMNALTTAGINNARVESGTATVAEAQEIALLQQWGD